MNIKTNDLKEILSPINRYLDMVGEDIAVKLKTGIPLIDNSAIHLFIQGGKKIRASLVILTGGLNGNIPGNIVEIASATEIVHTATLVHDDIIDQTILRRGDFTVSKKWGNKIAVLAGDYMYTKALDSVVRAGSPEMFSVIVVATNEMVKGELYQLQYSGIDVISMEHYFNIIELKTARFMAGCTKLGALCAGLPADQCEKLYEFGLNIGFAFQIVDDTLDVVDNTITGKDTGNDFMDGKVTLPLLYLLEQSGDKRREAIREYIINPERSNWEIVKDDLKKSGAVELSLDAAGKYVDRALNIIDDFPDTEFKDILINLSNFFILRNY